MSALQDVVKPAGLSLATASVAWVLHNPVVTSAIIGASHPEQLSETLRAADVRLDPEPKRRLDELTQDYRRGDAAR